MPQSPGIQFTADPLTFVVRHQLWDANVDDSNIRLAMREDERCLRSIPRTQDAATQPFQVLRYAFENVGVPVTWSPYYDGGETFGVTASTS